MKRSGRDYKADNYLSIAGATLIGRSIEETKIPVHIAAEPLDCVAMGMGYCLERGNI